MSAIAIFRHLRKWQPCFARFGTREVGPSNREWVLVQILARYRPVQYRISRGGPFRICWKSGDAKMIFFAAARSRSTASPGNANEVGN